MLAFKVNNTLAILVICFGVLLCLNNLPGRYRHAPEPFAPFYGPSTQDIIDAALRQYNPIAPMLNAIGRARIDTPIPGYNPVKRLSGTKDDDLIEQSLADVNPAQTDARIAEKYAEIKDRRTLAAAGWYGALDIALISLIASCFVALGYRHRLSIVKAADAALVAGLAHGVRLNRKAQAGRKSLVDRAKAKADEHPPER